MTSTNTGRAAARARDLFVDETSGYGCAEAVFIALKEAWGLPDPTLSDAAMALNGGVAHSGGPCGAVTGAALAVGLLAGKHVEDHREANAAARRLTADLAADFERTFGSTMCRDLTGYDISTDDGHTAFIASGVWRTRCARHVETAAGRLESLGDRAAFEAAGATLGNPSHAAAGAAAPKPSPAAVPATAAPAPSLAQPDEDPT